MIDLIVRKHPLGGETRYYQDRTTHAQFTDIVAAWTWPERLNGHMIVLGLARQMDIPQKENRTILCLQEWDVADIQSVVRLVAPATAYYEVSEWIADVGNLAAFEAFGIEQERMPKSLKRYWPVEPPFARDTRKRFARYAHAVRDQFPKGKEPKLHFGSCEMARMSARQIQIDADSSVEDFPVIGALGFGISFMRMHRGGRDEA